MRAWLRDNGGDGTLRGSLVALRDVALDLIEGHVGLFLGCVNERWRLGTVMPCRGDGDGKGGGSAVGVLFGLLGEDAFDVICKSTS